MNIVGGVVCHAARHVGSQFPDRHRNCTPCLEKHGVTSGLPGKSRVLILKAIKAVISCHMLILEKMLLLGSKASHSCQ